MSSHHLDAHAARIAEAVDIAWHSSHQSGRLDVPICVVAALSLLRHDSKLSETTVSEASQASPEEFAGLLCGLVRGLVRMRPDQAIPLVPMIRWLVTDQPDGLLVAAQHTAHAALNAGLLEVTGTEQRHHVDLLGVTLTQLRSRTAKTTHGQFFTPPQLAELMAALTMSEPDNPDPLPSAGQWVCDPTVGTGGLFRGLAASLRKAGRDPAEVRWAGADTDELAVACCAVNAWNWELGPHVVLAVADVLTERDCDWFTRAQAQQKEVLTIASYAEQIRQFFQLMDDGPER